MGDKNKVKLKICGTEFWITTDDDEDYVRAIAEKVDDHIHKLMTYSPSMSTTMAALFAALVFCDEATKSRETADNLRAQIKDYLEDAGHAKAEAAELRRREQTLLRENRELKLRLENRGLQK